MGVFPTTQRLRPEAGKDDEETASPVTVTGSTGRDAISRHRSISARFVRILHSISSSGPYMARRFSSSSISSQQRWMASLISRSMASSNLNRKKMKRARLAVRRERSPCRDACGAYYRQPTSIPDQNRSPFPALPLLRIRSAPVRVDFRQRDFFNVAPPCKAPDRLLAKIRRDGLDGPDRHLGQQTLPAIA